MFAQLTRLGRIGQPDEMAAAALFLASNDSSYSTGIDFVADGGLIQFWPGRQQSLRCDINYSHNSHCDSSLANIMAAHTGKAGIVLTQDRGTFKTRDESGDQGPACSDAEVSQAKRRLLLGDGNKKCDGEPVAGRHLIALLFDLNVH
jgi:hypothetical protein